MRNEYYEELLRCLDAELASSSINGPGEGSFNAKLLEPVLVGNVNLTIKNYKLTKGLSYRFFEESMIADTYEITGPMGKGLGLTKDSQGRYLAFAAGTGVLVFIDLVAKMILQYLDAPFTESEELLHDDFKLVFYASFQNKDDSIALQLLQGLQNLVKKRGCEDKFQLVTRFSDDQAPRWDKEFLKQQLTKHTSSTKNANESTNQSIQKVWVCGPPLLEEVFDKALFDLAPQFDLDFKTQVDLL